MNEFKRTICWFSCGAASAIATKIALNTYNNCVIVYQDTGSEHPDNKRFLKDCEEYFGQEIEIIKSKKYKDIWEVFKKTRWLVGVNGARCTSELKRKVAEDYLNHYEDREILGYTIEETTRTERFRNNNPERFIECPLIDRGYSKEDCFLALAKADIVLPKMYQLGFSNNNCIGCVKGQQGYWNHIRKHFPDVFERMSKVERKLDAAINKTYVNGKRIRTFLDELPEDAGNISKEPSIGCGLFCDTEGL